MKRRETEVSAMKKCVRVVVIVAAVLGVSCGTVFAQGDQIKKLLPTKWSQWVDLESGYDIYSFWHEGDNGPTTVVADDWRCPDGRPVTDVHWWGSYIEGDPTGLVGFEISIHDDIAPDGIHPSHPGALRYSETFERGQFTEVPFGVLTGPDGPVYQYNVDLTVPFDQDQGVIYWLNIIALVDNDAVWGWHTAVRPQPDNTLDDAVQIFGYNPETGQYSTYVELFDAQGSVAMAFELTTVVPEPATLTLAGLAGLALLGLRRRRSRAVAVLLV
ncbi:MAG TPA: PEP-CTERM sorting domain-containing protein, partial [Planctomycetota bacterium]|nr:PEP-CTERM sorting domain-containing protein [Planctomycetota bacterium]